MKKRSDPARRSGGGTREQSEERLRALAKRCLEGEGVDIGFFGAFGEESHGKRRSGRTKSKTLINGIGEVGQKGKER